MAVDEVEDVDSDGLGVNVEGEGAISGVELGEGGSEGTRVVPGENDSTEELGGLEPGVVLGVSGPGAVLLGTSSVSEGSGVDSVGGLGGGANDPGTETVDAGTGVEPGLDVVPELMID